MNKIKTRLSIRTMLVGLLACSMMSCADNTLEIDIIKVKGEPHDASKPIKVTDWSPKEGGSGQQMVVYGENFGNDPSIIKVAIGGNEAVVVSAVGDAIYCMIPSKPESDVAPDFNGDEDEDYTPEAQEPEEQPEDDGAGFGLTVAVGPEGSMKVSSVANAFHYQKVLRVGTLLGTVNDKNELMVKDGPFEDCGNFDWPQMFAVDPLNPNHLYVSKDGGDVRLIDFDNRYVHTIIKGNTTPNNRIRSVSFCPTNILKRRQDGTIKELYPDFELEPYPADGDVGAYDLILSHDTWTQSNPTVTLYRRNRGGATLLLTSSVRLVTQLVRRLLLTLTRLQLLQVSLVTVLMFTLTLVHCSTTLTLQPRCSRWTLCVSSTARRIA